MTQTTYLMLALVSAGAIYGQNTRPPNTSFQYFGTEGGPGVRMLGLEGISSEVVKGKPFSGTEERHSLQVLGDGTRIENTDRDKIYRDDQGRTRIERANGSVTIHDPVQGSVLELNLNDKTVRNTGFNFAFKTVFSGSPSPESLAADKVKAEGALREALQKKIEMRGMENVIINGDPGLTSHQIVIQRFEGNASKPAEVSIGTQSINGVLAEGRRSVIEIPAGQIGNDRPLQVVSERWFSNDLQMVVKSTNSDPRFGETSFQLTGISQGAQDPALFTAPADFARPTR